MKKILTFILLIIFVIGCNGVVKDANNPVKETNYDSRVIRPAEDSKELVGNVGAILGKIFVICCNGGNTMKNDTVVLETSKGMIKFKSFTNEAPITTTNFKNLVEAGFYDGLTFHRYVEGFVIQGGDPNGDGTGGSEEQIDLEIHPKLRHSKAGMVAMARAQDPNSASSQFYITLAKLKDLDDRYAVFGEVTEGLDVALQLRQGDVMEKVYLE